MLGELEDSWKRPRKEGVRPKRKRRVGGDEESSEKGGKEGCFKDKRKLQRPRHDLD